MGSPRRSSGRRMALGGRASVLLTLLPRLLAVLVAVLVLFLGASYLAPLVAGGSSFTIDAGDDASVLPDGTLAFVRPVRTIEIVAGDIITIRDSTSVVTTRRVVGIGPDQTLVVEGADETSTESVSGDEVDGRVWLHFRALGAVREQLATVPALAALATLALLLAVPTLLGVLGRRRCRGGHDREVRLQVLLVVLADADNLELRFTLAELGGSVVGRLDRRTRLIRLSGTSDELDRAEVRLARIGRVDATRRSPEVSMRLPTSRSTVAI